MAASSLPFAPRSHSHPSPPGPFRGDKSSCGAAGKQNLKESNLFTACWNWLTALLLLYTGTIFCWVICFLDFRVDVSGDAEDPWDLENNPERPLMVLDEIVYWFFVVDLVLRFFFSYRDEKYEEVVDLPMCAARCLKTQFVLNCAACFPAQYFYDTHVNQAARVLRTQRLARMLRLLFLVKVNSSNGQGMNLLSNLLGDCGAWVEQHKVMRIVKLCFGLLWIVHILCCGWYLLAFFATDPMQTWVARRVLVDEHGANMLLGNASPAQIWVQSMYFVFAVFTTCGFGDIAGLTMAECIYCIFLMVVGVMVHSTIIGEVLNLVTGHDRLIDFVNARVDLVVAFAEHTELGKHTKANLSRWIRCAARDWMVGQYDKEGMRKLITGKYMPRDLMAEIPAELFGGLLYTNDWLNGGGILPVHLRLPMLLALHMTRKEFAKEDVIYCKGDFPFNMYLVMRGVFIYSDTVIGSGAYEPRSLLPQSSYFGDYEMFRGCSRLHNVECTTDDASCLVLPRTAVRDIVEDFPDWGAMWQRKAEAKVMRLRRAERCRDACVMSYAARIIQRLAMRVRERRATKTRDAVEEVMAAMPRPPAPSYTWPRQRWEPIVSAGVENRTASTAADKNVSARITAIEAKLDTIMELLRNPQETSLERRQHL